LEDLLADPDSTIARGKARAALTPTEEPATCPTCGAKGVEVGYVQVGTLPDSLDLCPDAWHGRNQREDSS
jgi:hypothetical protein